MAALAGAWLAYAIIIAVDIHESERLATIVTICSLALCLSAIALFPVDIFLVSSTVDLNTGLKHSWATQDQVQSILNQINGVYYGMYGLIAIFCSLVIPFAYFYFEEYDEGETNRQRIAGALKYTGFFLAFMLICFVFGIILQPKEKKIPLDLDFFKKFLSESLGESSISFIIAILMIIGMIVFVVYTAPGLSLLPIRMIKGANQTGPSISDIEGSLRLNREKQRVITSKYQDSNNPMARKDEQRLKNLLTEEKILARRLQVYEANSRGLLNKILVIFRPFECNHTTIDKVRNCSDYPMLIIPCDVKAPTGNFDFLFPYICTPTAISTFIQRITFNTPFFGVVFYYAQWAFLMVLAIGFVYSIIRPQSYISLDDFEDELQEDNEELLHPHPVSS
ncbi:10067_t:CDS:2 [Scutellospora calospora]|uniref:10067_t:CDS:1 n=1 Tax=Scutellospora calospora TaxID=85575 RepID=A0ACA9L9C3_9GLOM|nr:10067_t:CDS:2 [Scutellospora calospora]